MTIRQMLRAIFRESRDVSDAWSRDHERRSWSAGRDDLPSIQFPIKKLLNESPLWNRHKMRKQA